MVAIKLWVSGRRSQRASAQLDLHDVAHGPRAALVAGSDEAPVLVERLAVDRRHQEQGQIAEIRMDLADREGNAIAVPGIDEDGLGELSLEIEAVENLVRLQDVPQQ